MPADMSGETILLIEDDDSGRELGLFNLRKSGFVAEGAADGEAGLLLFAPERHALVITDVKMPGISGLEVLRRVKEQGPVRKLVPFVMEERAVPRQSMPIEGGGEVTSGTHSPMLDVGIGMGYVPRESAQPDSELVIDVRGKPRRARVVKKPIYRKEQ